MNSYRGYIDQEDAIIRSQGEERGRMRTIGLRDQFLGSLDGSSGPPNRIHHYDDRFITDSLAQGKVWPPGCPAGGNERRTPAEQADHRRSAEELRRDTAEERRHGPAIKAFLKNLQILTAGMK